MKNECLFHALELPCYTCIAENRAMIGEFHRAAKTPGMILTHWEHAVDEGYWSESKFRIEADGSRTLLSQRTFKPGESDAD